jgi:Ribosomal protein S20
VPLMPNTKSAIRRVKRVKKQSLVNKLRRSRYRLAIKKINKLIEKKDLQSIKKFYPKFQSELMKIAKTGVIKRENASRKIARISKKIKKINK